jgi:peptidoglycan/xylan/chitin deacetylase (PgdA/CDA1 family)
MRFRRQRMGRGGYSPTAGLHFDDQEFESRIVWVWSTARSGSTWLLRMLSHPVKLVDSSHDDDDYLGFLPPRAWQGKVDLIPVDTTFISNHLMPFHGTADYSDDLVPRTFASALGLRNRANYFFSPKYADAWRPEMRRMMLVRFHRFLERAAERYDTDNPLLLLKEVAGAHAAPLVMSMFPRSKMVFLLRDGRDVVDSQTAGNAPGGWLPITGWTNADEREEYVRRRSRTWVGDVTRIDQAFQAHPAERRMMVRYEDLLASPVENLRSLIEFMGLRKGERWIERSVEVNAFESVAPEHKGPTKFFRSASPGAWQSNMTETEAAILHEVMGDKIRELGYPAAEGSEGVRSNGAASEGPPAEASSPFSDEAPDASPSTGDVLSTTVSRAGEGRDYTNLIRLVNRRGSPASRRERKVALTFDDGPVLQTHAVLETLERYGARGTFFLVGRKIDGQEELVHRLLSGGHEIGNHSYGHAPFPPADDVSACAAVIEHVTGEKPRLFRPPFGAVDTPGAEAAIEDGMRVILWSVDSEDALPPWKGISADEITDNVLDLVGPGAIVLLHDGLPWSRAADALPNLVERLLADGYQLVTVSELLAGGDPRPVGRAARIMRRLRGARPGRASTAATKPTASTSANGAGPAGVDVRQRLRELLERLTGYVEPPQDGEPAAELIRGARERLLGPGTDSDLLLRHAAAYDGNSLLVISLGFSLRRFESERHEAAPLQEEFTARLRQAADPVAEAGVVAEQLAGPRRHKRLMASRLAGQAAATAGGETGMPIAGAPDPPVEAPHSASADFLSIFAPGSDEWQQIESWARATGRHVARQRNRALLDAAGMDGAYDVEPLVDRLDVDFLFRFGYVLASCEEELSRADS